MHQAAAEYYAIPAVNMGKVLFEKLEAEQCGPEKYLPDGVHPNDAGYKIYADTILQKLFEMDFSFAEKEPMQKEIYEDAHLVLAGNLESGIWKKSHAIMCRRLDNYLYAYELGAEFEFKFDGKIIGLYWTVEKDSGDIIYRIDGGGEHTCSSWDKYANSFPRAHYCILKSNMAAGPHVLKIRISEQKNPQSEGHYIRIGAFLVG